MENVPSQELEESECEVIPKEVVDSIWEKEWFAENWKDKQSRLGFIVRNNKPNDIEGVCT